MAFIVRHLVGRLYVNGGSARAGTEIPADAQLEMSPDCVADIQWCEPFARLAWGEKAATAQIDLVLPPDGSVWRVGGGESGPDRLALMSSRGGFEVVSRPTGSEGQTAA
jgi:hypothetical protein